MPDKVPSLNRRTAIKALSVTGAASWLGVTTPVAGTQGRLTGATLDPDSDDEQFEDEPAINIPVIDAYYEGEKVWFLHTSVSSKQMVERLTEMINYPTLHVPKLAEIVDIEALGDIYVFKNGVDQSDVEPWGGGPFGFQIDIMDSIPGDQAYTPLRRPNIVTWCENAKPKILTSVDDLLAARDAGKVTIQPTDVVVTAPIVSWPDDPFPDELNFEDDTGSE